MYELPEHLASLNSLPTTSTPVDQSAEDAVWEYFNTDALFQTFGVNPSEYESKLDAGPSTRVDPNATLAGIPVTPQNGQNLPGDLKSFIEQFATTTETFGSNDYANALALGLHMTTPVSTANMADILASAPDDKPSGAKKLKQLGAAQAEVEEDKRRRNTEASARFRAKKKERENALEMRAKELEGQVSQLQTEKSSLENENRLLKAIVLGSRGGGEGAQEALEQFLGKRKRSE